MRGVKVVENAPNPSTMHKNYIWGISNQKVQYLVVFAKKFQFGIFFRG